MTLAPGTTLGRYQILEPLGSGGMATVYKAYEPSLDRVVALKVIRPGLSAEADFVARFRREAQAVAKLAHPNVVQVFAFDEAAGQLFLAMQYLEGGTLKDRLATLPTGSLLDPAEVASLVSQVAAALAYAHGRGIVHRDIKPSNVMLTEDRAIVTDFGIAKMVSGAQLTQTGVGIGTPEYMSPEQGQGGEVDARADVYSLGVVAYELLTGRVPYIADTPFAVVAAHMRDPVPLPSSINPSIPAEAERALLKALAKQPAQRFASATEFASALAAGLRGAPAVATMSTIAPARAKPDTRSFTFTLPALPRSRPALAAIGTAALIVVAGTGALVSGSLGRGAATPNASAPAGASAPKFAIPAKGALIWQAKLDGTDADMRGTRGLGSNTDATMSDLRFVPGAIEFVILKSNGATSFTLNSPARATFVAEIDVDASADKGGGLDLQWRGPNPRYDLAVNTTTGGIALNYLQDSVAGSPPTATLLIPSAPAAEVLSGGTYTLALTVESSRFTAHLNQRQVLQASDGRIAPAATGVSLLYRGGVGTVRITGIRLYELPAAAVSVASPASASASFGSPKYAIPAKGKQIYEARLDGTRNDMGRVTQLGDASASAIRQVPGAIELEVIRPSTFGGGRVDCQKLPDQCVTAQASFNMSGVTGYVGELDVSVAPSADVVLSWALSNFRGQLYYLAIQTVGNDGGDGGLFLGCNAPGCPPASVIFEFYRIPGLQGGNTFTVAVVVEEKQITLFLDQKPLGTVGTPSPINGLSIPALSIHGPNDIPGKGLVRILGARFYELPPS